MVFGKSTEEWLSVLPDAKTALDVALMGNANRELYLPWLISFDCYGFFAEELLVSCMLSFKDEAMAVFR